MTTYSYDLLLRPIIKSRVIGLYIGILKNLLLDSFQKQKKNVKHVRFQSIPRLDFKKPQKGYAESAKLRVKVRRNPYFYQSLKQKVYHKDVKQVALKPLMWFGKKICRWLFFLPLLHAIARKISKTALMNQNISK